MATIPRLRIAALALCVAPSSVPAAAAVLDEGEPSVAEVTPTELEGVRLMRLLRDPAGPEARELVAAYAGLGLEHLPTSAAWLRARRVPGHDGRGDMVLSVYQEELLLAAFEVWGREAVRAHLGEVPPAEREPAERVVAILMLGASGRAEDLTELLQLALVEGEDAPTRASTEALEVAVTRLLERAPETFDELEGLRIESPDLLAALVTAVGNRKAPRGLTFLYEQIAWSDELVALILAQVERIGPSFDLELNRKVGRSLRRHLDPSNRNVCQAAALALAEMQDFDSVPALIELLDEDDAGLGQNAYAALVQLTGCSFSPRAELWRRWLASEEEWFRREEYRAFKNLHSPDEGTVAKSIRAIAARRLKRHELALELAEALQHPSERIQLLTIGALVELGSHHVAPQLVERLEADRPAVVEAAWNALRALTGEDHAKDAAAWRAAFELKS